MPPRSSKNPSKGKAKANAATLRPTPKFLTIPLEVREVIYTHVLWDYPSSLTDLITVNRRLSAEVLPFQFKRHLTFYGQIGLFKWLDNVEHQYLHHVVNVSFQLHDIDPEKIVGALGKRLRQANIVNAKSSSTASPRGNPYHEACDAELRKLGEAFKLIPNVQKLTILTTYEGDPQPPQRMLSLFSKLLGHRFRHLHTLICYEDALEVEFLANKPDLRRLRIPAISPSSDATVAEIFSNLSLLELELYRIRGHTPVEAPKRRILSQIFRSLPPLRTLLLSDDDIEADDPDLIYETFVQYRDAFAKHKASLRELKFTANLNSGGYAEDDWMFESRKIMKKFIRDSSHRMRAIYLDTDTWVDQDTPYTAPEQQSESESDDESP